MTNALFRYEEVDRTARAVYLYDRSRKVEVELNLSTRTIFYTTPHNTRRALFRIGQEQFAEARAAPRVCRRAVQGQIAWNYQGERRWNPENVRKLCAGASNAEPAYCFDQVMHGGVFWGGGTQWQWHNALSLCAGAVDARRTIRCFERELEFTNDWRQAINRCRQRSLGKAPSVWRHLAASVSFQGNEKSRNRRSSSPRNLADTGFDEPMFTLI